MGKLKDMMDKLLGQKGSGVLEDTSTMHPARLEARKVIEELEKELKQNGRISEKSFSVLQTLKTLEEREQTNGALSTANLVARRMALETAEIERARKNPIEVNPIPLKSSIFNDVEKGLIEKGLTDLREKLENNRSFFEMGSVQREHLERKIDAICDLRNNLYKSDFAPMEKIVILEALDGMKETFIKNRSVFDVGSVQKEHLEANLDRIDNIKNNINNAKSLGSLDSFINAAKQQQSNQPFQNAPQRNNDLVI